MKSKRKMRPRGLQFETLEAREVMAAGVTATLNAGVLTVTCTNGNDAVNFLQSKGNIAISGVSGSWKAAAVKSISIDLKGGNDVVSLNSKANGGKELLQESVTVIGGSDGDRVRLADGKDVYFAGAGNVLDVAANGALRINGYTLNLGSAPIVELSAGVLTITGTFGNDNIQLVRSNDRFSIKGVSGSWAASSVTSIAINLQAGADNVSLDTIANGGSQALGVAVTVYSGAGSDSVRLPNGKDVTFSGAGHLLTWAVNGTAKLDGTTLSWDTPSPNPPAPNPPAPNPPTTNWFDTHVTDAALRSLGHTLYTDGLINRTDMIDLLRASEDGGVIDATELTDLRTIAGTTSLFGSMDYVRVLTTYIVNGSVANRNYQGQALGGFGAGSATAQLEKLINKWFLGLDRPTAAGAYRQFAGSLFVNGAAYSDIHQGAVGDCYFVSMLGEVAHKNSGIISNMFVVNGDGTYTVKFFNPMGQADYVTVDSYLPTNSAGQLIYASRGSLYNNANNELWVAVAEKAYAQLNEFGWSRGGSSQSGQNSYDALSGGYLYAALNHITGQSTAAFTMTSGASSFNTFVTAYNAGKMIGFASFSAPQSSSVVGGHAYAVVGYNASTQSITLFNPWGTEYGLVTMTWAQIQQNFMYFDRTA